MREPPRWFRASLARAYGQVLEEWAATKAAGSWKLFILIPRLLLRPTAHGGAKGKAVFQERLRRFQAGEWVELLADARGQAAEDADRGPRPSASPLLVAEAKVRLGEVSRARQILTSPGLAPGTQATLEQLTDPDLRPQALAAPLPEGLLEFEPTRVLVLDRGRLANALRGAGRGSAADLSGTRYEHLRVL